MFHVYIYRIFHIFICVKSHILRTFLNAFCSNKLCLNHIFTEFVRKGPIAKSVFVLILNQNQSNNASVPWYASRRLIRQNGFIFRISVHRATHIRNSNVTVRQRLLLVCFTLGFNFSCHQTSLCTVFPYVCLPVTPFSQFSQHRILKFSFHWLKLWPCKRLRWDVKGQDYRGQNKFCPSSNWKKMSMKWWTEIEVISKNCHIEFQGHQSNSKVTQDLNNKITNSDPWFAIDFRCHKIDHLAPMHFQMKKVFNWRMAMK